MGKAIIVLMAMSFVCNLTALGQKREVVTLDDALNIHLYNTRNVRIQCKSYENALLEYKIYRKSLLPSIQIDLSPLAFNHSMKMLQNAVSGEYKNVDEFSNTSSAGVIINQTIGATGGVFSLGSSLSYLREFSSKTNSFSARPLFASYSQQLFGGRKTYKNKKRISEKAHDMALKDYCSAITTEEQTIVGLYLNALTAKMDQDYYSRTCSIGDTLVTHARLRLNSGKITEYDFNQIELQQMADEMSLAKANEDYSNAIKLLEMELGKQDIDVCAPCNTDFPSVISHERVLELVRKNNSEYLSSELQRLNAEYTLYNAKLSNRFNANISLTYGLNQYGQTFGAAYTHPNQQQAVSVTLSIPAFEWGANKDRIKIAQNNYDAAILQQESVLEKFEQQIAETVNAYNRSVATVAVAEKRYSLAMRQYEFAVQRFAVGKTSAVELSSAGNEQFRARQEYMGVQRELYTMYYQIRHLTVYDFISDKDIENR